MHINNDSGQYNSAVQVSVITVAWNAAATIADTCRSAAAQQHEPIEHLVIDGASIDDTVAVARRHLRAGGRIVSEPDRGLYDAMNKGFRLACGEVIGFLNADDLFADRHALSRVARVFRDPTVDVCYGDLVYVRQDNPDDIIRYWRSGRLSRASFAFGLMPAHPTFYVRRSVLERCGLFDLSLPMANDYEFTVRYCVRHRLKTAYIPRVQVRMRLGGISNASVKNVMRQNAAIFSAMRGNRIVPSYLYPLGKLLVKARQFVTRPPG